MRVLTVKKIGLVIGVLTIFLAIPVSTAFAQMAMKGNPVVECTKAELILPQEKIANNEFATYADFVFDLKITLRALKHKATAINATLRFKDEPRLMVEQTIIGEGNKPIIIQKQGKWDAIEYREEKENILPFQIKGFNRLPEKIEFELDITYRNPNDEEIYSTTLSIFPGIPETTVNIENVTNAPDKYKGEKVPISVTIKNTGSNNAYGIIFWIKIQSVYATGASGFGYRNDDGNIVLTQMFYFISDIISPGAQKQYNVEFNYAQYNGAMNVGQWKVIEVAAQAGNSNFDVQSCNDIFNVNAKTLSSGPHAVFIYYLWNGIGSFAWNENPRPYFEHTTFGDVKAGLYMFKKQYNQRTDNYIDFNMIICKEDSNWEVAHYPSGGIDDVYTSAINRVGSVLNIAGGKWKGSTSKALYVDNCGFDLLLIVSTHDYGGYAFTLNCALACRSGAATWDLDWKYNIDDTVQHEISHCFGTKDYHDGHTLTKCIMVYRIDYWWKIPIYYENYFHERLAFYLGNSVHDPTNNWCTISGSTCCTAKFTENWNQYYIANTT